MGEEKKPNEAWEKLQKSFDRQLRYEERVIFDTPKNEGCSGALKGLDELGGLLVTIDQIPPNSEIFIEIKLSIAGQTTELVVSGRVAATERGIQPPLRGYRIVFNQNNPEVVKKALRDLAQAQRNVAAQAQRAPSSARVQEQASRVPQAPPKAPPPKKSPPAASPAEIQFVPPPTVSGEWPRGLLVTTSVIGLIVGGIFLFDYIQSSRFASKFSKVIPVTKVEREGRDLTAEVQETWLTGTTRAEKVEQLRSFGMSLAEEKIQSALIVDSSGGSVALIMVPDAGRNRQPNVRFYGSYK